MTNKDSEGFYDRDYIKSLEPREILKLFIRETSYQETLNTVRNEVVIETMEVEKSQKTSKE